MEFLISTALVWYLYKMFVGSFAEHESVDVNFSRSAEDSGRTTRTIENVENGGYDILTHPN